MIIFLLVYMADTYPYVKKIVYTFHVPAFLVISGYVSNVSKVLPKFLRDLYYFFLPYMLMEFLYICMVGLLPTREPTIEMSFPVVIRHIVLSPIGPYWYLHTLFICYGAYYFCFRCPCIFDTSSSIILLAITLYILSLLHLVNYSNVVYYIAGVSIRQSEIPFMKFFTQTWLIVVMLLLLCIERENLERSSIGGLAITYSAISSLLLIHGKLPSACRDVGYYIGCNTLVILLFSPIFTFISKLYLPLFAFDPSGFLFTLITVFITISGSLVIAHFCDILHLSRIVFGKDKVLATSYHKIHPSKTGLS